MVLVTEGERGQWREKTECVNLVKANSRTWQICLISLGYSESVEMRQDEKDAEIYQTLSFIVTALTIAT